MVPIAMSLQRDSVPSDAAPPAAACDPDLALLRRAQDGEVAAVEELLRAIAPAAYRVARAILGTDADAEDATQQAMWTVAGSWSRYRGQGSVRAWILGITARTARTWRRARARRQRHEAACPRPLPAPEPADAERVWAAVASLPEGARTVVALHFQAGLSMAEIAQQLRRPRFTIHSRLRRALARLRETLPRETMALAVVLSDPIAAPAMALAGCARATSRRADERAVRRPARRLRTAVAMAGIAIVGALAAAAVRATAPRLADISASASGAGDGAATGDVPSPPPPPAMAAGGDALAVDLSELPPTTALVLIQYPRMAAQAMRLPAASDAHAVEREVDGWGPQGFASIATGTAPQPPARWLRDQHAVVVQGGTIHVVDQSRDGTVGGAYAFLSPTRLICGTRAMVEATVAIHAGSPGGVRPALRAEAARAPRSAWMCLAYAAPWPGTPLASVSLSQAVFWITAEGVAGSGDCPTPADAQRVAALVAAEAAHVARTAAAASPPTRGPAEPAAATGSGTADAFMPTLIGALRFHADGCQVQLTGPPLEPAVESQLLHAFTAAQ